MDGARYNLGGNRKLLGTGQSKRELARQQPVYPNYIPPPRPAAPIPTGENNWVEYAQRNPAVTLNMMEKVQVDDRQFVAERYIKMSGPPPTVNRPEVYVSWAPQKLKRSPERIS